MAPAHLAFVNDKLVNAATGLGTHRDKSVGNVHARIVRTREQYDAAYRSNAFVRKGIDLVPFDMLRAWRQWQGKERTVGAIEAAETVLDYRRKLMAAMIRGRLYGGGAILVGTTDTDLSRELVVESIPKGGITYLHVLTKDALTAHDVIRDVTSPYFGEPTYYEIANEGGETARIHPSRLIRFLGAPLPDDLIVQADAVWSDSILDATFDAVNDAGLILQTIAGLLPDAKTEIVSIPGLSELVATTEGEARVKARFATASLIRSMYNITLLDSGENGLAGDTWDQKQLSFANLDKIAYMALQVLSGAFNIPATRFLSQSPAGLNSTGESDLKNYYDHVSALQNVELGPTIRRLDRMMLRHTFGSEPRGVWYEWRPLYQPSDKEKAETGKLKAETAKILAESRTIPREVQAKGVKSWLVNSDLFPGIEDAYDEHKGPLAEEAEVTPSQEQAAQPTEPSARVLEPEEATR